MKKPLPGCRLLLVVALLIFGLIAHAQLPTYLQSYASRVTSSPGVLDGLGQRFLDGDTTLTTQDVALLYYGSAFLTTYSPYGEAETAESVLAITGGKNKKEAVRSARFLVSRNPAFLQMYHCLSVAGSQLGQLGGANFALNRYLTLLDAPLSSGDGRGPETAFVIRSVADMYDVLTHFGLDQLGRRELSYTADGTPIERVVAGNAEGERQVFYFNLYLPYVVGGDKVPPQNRRSRRKR